MSWHSKWCSMLGFRNDVSCTVSCCTPYSSNFNYIFSALRRIVLWVTVEATVLSIKIEFISFSCDEFLPSLEVVQVKLHYSPDHQSTSIFPYRIDHQIPMEPHVSMGQESTAANTPAGPVIAVLYVNPPPTSPLPSTNSCYVNY